MCVLVHAQRFIALRQGHQAILKAINIFGKSTAAHLSARARVQLNVSRTDWPPRMHPLKV